MIKFRARKGDTVRIYPGELLREDGTAPKSNRWSLLFAICFKG
jgi:hypothetical protein